MADTRLSALDLAFLSLEGETTPMHMGAVATFRPNRTVDPGRLLAVLAARARAVPELRSRVRQSRWPLGGASWVDDPGFDPADHLEAHHLPLSFEPDPLAAHAAAWLAEPLDTSAPLWRLQVVTGLPDGGFAVLLKLHHALTDGEGVVAVATALLDEVPTLRRMTPREPGPGPEKSTVDSLVDEAAAALGKVSESAGIAGAVLRAAKPYPISRIATRNSPARRLGFVRLETADIRRIRKAHGGTAHDVVLAVLSGALREWLHGRGKRVGEQPLRALIPVSLRGRNGSSGGNRLSGYLCELPAHIDDPVLRLREVRGSMRRHKAGGPARGPGAFPVLANRVPAGMHRLATRFAGHAAPLLFDTVVTSVPLPGVPLRLDGAALGEVYPFVPLAPHHTVGIAVSTYRSGVHIGLQANGEAVDDLGALADAVLKSASALGQRS